jgi:hypothetical protein
VLLLSLAPALSPALHRIAATQSLAVLDRLKSCSSLKQSSGLPR